MKQVLLPGKTMAMTRSRSRGYYMCEVQYTLNQPFAYKIVPSCYTYVRRKRNHSLQVAGNMK